MKYIVLISSLMTSFVVHAAPTCSKNGTKVIYTNGVTTSKDNANIALRKIQDLSLSSRIDLKRTSYRLAYNYEESMSRDFLEVAVQRFPKRYLDEIGVKDPYAAYQPYLVEKCQDQLTQMN